MSARGKTSSASPGSHQSRRLLVITDLDGTLLDRDTYDWRPAASTLAELRRRKIPLILCTSKTRAEVEVLRRKMGHHDPYIAENGGILVLPWRFLGKTKLRTSTHPELVVHLGRSYPDILRALTKFARLAKVRLRGFHAMTAEDVSRMTGLALPDARRARQREASEPFRFVNADPARIQAFRRIARQYAMEAAEGRRFWHLSAGSDKGQAIGVLTCFYELLGGTSVWKIVLGDSSIDLPMLEQAELPILMSKADGIFDARITRRIPGIVRVEGQGPLYWAKAVQTALQRYEQNAALSGSGLHAALDLQRPPDSAADIRKELSLRRPRRSHRPPALPEQLRA